MFPIRLKTAGRPALALGVLLLLLATGGPAAEPVKKKPADKDRTDPPLKEMTRRELQGPGRYYRNLIFSADGKLLAAGASQDTTVSVWDVSIGKEKVRLQMPGKNYDYHLAFTADGRTLISEAREDDMIRTWDVSTGKQVREIGRFSPTFLAFAPGGRLAALSGPVTIRGTNLVEVATGKLVLQITDLDDARGCAFSPDSKVLAVHGGFGDVQLRDVATGGKIRTLREKPRHGGGAFAFATYSPDGKHLATGGHIDKMLRVWEVATGKERLGLTCQGFFVSASFSRDGNLLATGSTDGLTLHDLARDKELARWRPVRSGQFVAFSPDGSLLAVPGQGGISLYELPPIRAEKLPKNLTETELTALCRDLATENDFRLQQVLATLQAVPGDAVPFLGKSLQTVAAAEKQHVEQLIADLDDDQFTKREEAMKELQKRAAAFEPLLAEAREKQPAGEGRNRLTLVLKNLKESELPRSLLVEQRAVDVLERIATSEARKVLEAAAAGAHGARLTEQAKAALERLAKRPAASK